MKGVIYYFSLHSLQNQLDQITIPLWTLLSSIPSRSASFDAKAVSQCLFCAVWLSHV